LDCFVVAICYNLLGFAFSYGIEDGHPNGFIGNHWYALKDLPGNSGFTNWLFAVSLLFIINQNSNGIYSIHFVPLLLPL
jgi:hypothetical protein